MWFNLFITFLKAINFGSIAWFIGKKSMQKGEKQYNSFNTAFSNGIFRITGSFLGYATPLSPISNLLDSFDDALST